MSNTSKATLALTHGTLPTLVFDAPASTDEPGTLDLRAFDTPTSDVELRNRVRQSWRARPRLVVRVDDEPTARIEALLLELARREVRLDATHTDAFDEKHVVVVKVSSKTPSARLARIFRVRVRMPTAEPATRPTTASTPKSAPRRTDAGRR